MKKILIISKESGQTEKFIRELPAFLKESKADFQVEFAFYPDYEKKVLSKDWVAIGLSSELLIEKNEIQKRLTELGIRAPSMFIRGMHFGLRRYDLIFPAITINGISMPSGRIFFW